MQVNVLAYFETLCTDTGSANVLINSSLTVLIVRMLRNARAATLRVRLASALGLLVRHATYIADELATTGAPSLLQLPLHETFRPECRPEISRYCFVVTVMSVKVSACNIYHSARHSATLLKVTHSMLAY